MHRRTLWTLYAGNLLTQIGLWFFLPLLPIFISRRGGSPALVGIVFASGILASALIRYPAGWAADRWGTRPVLLGAMAAYSALFLAYLLPLPLPALVAVRALQGAAAGAYWPAANGLIGHLTPPGDRGRAFGLMQSTSMAGMVIGPGIGGFIALFNLSAVFVVSACVCAVATVALSRLPNVRAEATPEAPVGAVRIVKQLMPFIVLGAGTHYMIGTYAAFVAFAIPAVVLSARAGAFGDRIGARRLVVVTLIGTAFFAALYPFIASVPWLIALGLVEGMFTVSGGPSLMAEVSRHAAPGQQGRTQGVFQTAQTLIQIAGALGGGALFALSPTYAFLAVTAVCLLGAATALRPAAIRSQQATEVR
jgi:MFS family permease